MRQNKNLKPYTVIINSNIIFKISEKNQEIQTKKKSNIFQRMMNILKKSIGGGKAENRKKLKSIRNKENYKQRKTRETTEEKQNRLERERKRKQEERELEDITNKEHRFKKSKEYHKKY